MINKIEDLIHLLSLRPYTSLEISFRLVIVVFGISVLSWIFYRDKMRVK